MNDISSQDQNQSHFKVPKEDLTNYKSQQQNLINQNDVDNQEQTNVKSDSSESSKSLSSLDNELKQNSTHEDQVNIVKAEPVPQKTVPVSNDISTSSTTNLGQTSSPSSNQPRLDHSSPASETQAHHIGKIDTKSLLISIIKYILFSILGIFIIFCLINWPAISLKFNYWWTTSIKKQNWTQLHPIELLQAQKTAQKLDENFLYIQSLGIQGPISWGIEEGDVKGMLAQGLVNYYAASLPDDATGNIFISGQTSAPIWSGSNSKTVFTLLNKIKSDAKILLVYKNLIYVYEVESIKSIGSNKVVITPGSEDNLYLNLLAQYPIGIGWKTLLVRAQLSNILDNVAESIDDKIKDSVDNSGSDLPPIEITPTTTTVPYPTQDYDPGDPLAPEVFLPGV